MHGTLRVKQSFLFTFERFLQFLKNLVKGFWENFKNADFWPKKPYLAHFWDN